METTLPDKSGQPWQGLSDGGPHRALSGHHELLAECGRGDMGVVYRARHRTLDRLVALKVMRPGAPLDRFLREAQLLAQIRSPHVVAVHDCEVLPDRCPMLAVEWVEGTNLLEVIAIRRGPLPEERCRRECARPAPAGSPPSGSFPFSIRRPPAAMLL
jgi:hypothetical protein